MSQNPYENFKKNLIQHMSLKKDELITERMFNSQYVPLFEVADEKDKLYEKILKELNYLAVIYTEQLIVDLFTNHNMESRVVLQHDVRSRFDLVVKINNKLVAIDLKTSPSVLSNGHALAIFRDEVSKCMYPTYLVFLIAEDSSFSGIKELKDLPNLRIMTFQTFIKEVFGNEELQLFNKAMLTYKDDMHIAMGYQITEIFNDQNLSTLKQELEKYLINLDYFAIKQQVSNEIKNQDDKFKDLYDQSFNDIVNKFVNGQQFKKMFGNSDFAKSFLTSEWLYKQYKGVDGLDNTFIVAGYLKSVEQLLSYIVHSRGKGRIISVLNKETTIDENYIDATLGDLEYFITDYNNLDLFEDKNKFFSRYLKAQLALWRTRYRNGYFHKHSLEDLARIKTIREETIFIYCLILGSLKI